MDLLEVLLGLVELSNIAFQLSNFSLLTFFFSSFPCVGDLYSSSLLTTTTKEQRRRSCRVRFGDGGGCCRSGDRGGDKVAVLDMYTQWCGPCKMIAPKLKELSEMYLDLKLDCNKENRPLAKELGLKVVPTFKILKDNKVVTEVTGAEIDKLIAAIDTVKSS